MKKGDRVVRASWYQETLKDAGANTRSLITSEGTVEEIRHGRPRVKWDAFPGVHTTDPMLVETVYDVSRETNLYGEESDDG